MSILDSMKKQIETMGQSKGEIHFVKKDEVGRIRFLAELDDGVECTMHGNFETGLRCVCGKTQGKECKWCGETDRKIVTHKQMFAWPIWDYESGSQKVFTHNVSRCSPLEEIIDFFNENKTIMDRDYKIKRKGNAIDTRYRVDPEQKIEFKTKVKVWTKAEILKKLSEAYPYSTTSDSAESKEDVPTTTEDKKEDNTLDYYSMDPKTLFKLCKDREIKIEAKKDEATYIALLEKYDSENPSDESGDDIW